VSRRGTIITLVLAVSLGVALLLSATASATLVHTHNFLSSFDGTGSSNGTEATGPFGDPQYVAIDQKTGNVYVTDSGYGGTVDKFDPNGGALAFSGLGAGVNSAHAGTIGGDAAVAVDNSTGASQGQIWVFQEGQQLHALNPSGIEIGGPNFPIEPFGDMCGGATDPQGNFWWSQYGGGAFGFSPGGESLAKSVPVTFGNCEMTIDTSQPPSETSGYFYITDWGGSGVYAFDKNGVEKWHLSQFGRGVAVDPSNGHIYLDAFDHVLEYEPSTTGTPGALVSEFGRADAAHGFPSGLCGNSRGIAVNETTHRVYVQDCGRVDVFGPGVEYIVPTVKTDAAEVEPTGATLRGHVDPDGGGDTTGCKFEWGLETTYGETAPCTPAGPIHNADGNTAVSAHITGLTSGTTYHYRIVATNANGQNVGEDVEFKPQGPPQFSKEFVSEVNTDGARLTGTIDPVGSTTEYHFEYGPDTNYGNVVPATDRLTKSPTQKETFTTTISGLAPGTTYHFRIVAKNESGTTHGNDITFRTFSNYSGEVDHCPNALVRKQTGSALLLDCRAYELASASYSGGYNVQSDLIPGEVPPVARPDAPDRLLYSLHYGAIPNIPGNPPNLGLDPYVAERGPDGWTTSYVGIPADGIPSVNAYGSPLAASDSALTTFAFGGANLCAPCFEDGSTGIPVRLPSGNLVQGLTGPAATGPGAEPSGWVAKELSADGTHLVFGSTTKLTSDGNAGELTIYDRDLTTGDTHAVSKKPDGSGTMTGAGIGELDLSADGSRILIGRKLSTDSAGNSYWHLYMNVGDSSKTADLMPSAAAGALYAGMTADGSKVFFVTPDKLLGSDTDNSADLYEADVAGNGTVTTQLVSVGSGGGNVDSCTPVAGKKAAHWNTVGAAANCDVVAFAGGAGVASSTGAVYFLSPEKLDGQGTLNSPNLFVRLPGQAPRFVATLEADSRAVKDGVEENELATYGDIQVTPDGEDAAFASTLPLTGYTNLGHSEIYRYDLGDEEVVCVSCALTGAAPSTDATLSNTGLNLSDDGRVFFTSGEQLALRDTNKQRDAYEWENGVVELISSGSSGTGSGLVTVSANGKDAFFFTRQVLSIQDANGTAMKVYDARSEGGFFADIEPPPCQASDECHGPGTQAAPPAQIGTLEGSVGNFTGKRPCRKGMARLHGRCVKKRRHGAHRHKRHHERSHG
jgi:hypothetical protein